MTSLMALFNLLCMYLKFKLVQISIMDPSWQTFWHIWINRQTQSVASVFFSQSDKVYTI